MPQSANGTSAERGTTDLRFVVWTKLDWRVRVSVSLILLKTIVTEVGVDPHDLTD